jgi:membrane protease YdiL (CAAX protease family)
MDNDRKLRAVELVLLLGVVFLPSIVQSAYVYFSHSSIMSSMREDTAFYFANSVLWESLGLCLLAYFMFRQNKTLSGMRFSFTIKDVLFGIGLFVLIYIDNILMYYLLTALSIKAVPPQNTDFLKGGINLFYVLFLLINPVFEEMIVRAFTITEVEFLAGKTYIAVIVSTPLQTSYHLYQGTYSALVILSIFFIFSLFYIKFRRIMPVIIAHALFDIIAMVQYSV